MAEHLAQNVHDESHTQEIFQTLFSRTGSPVPENKIREFEVEMERLNSKIEHLKVDIYMKPYFIRSAPLLK